MDRLKDWSLWLDNDSQEYYLFNFNTEKEFYLSKKISRLIHRLKSQSWKYTLLSGKCDDKIEDICEKIIKEIKNG